MRNTVNQHDHNDDHNNYDDHDDDDHDNDRSAMRRDRLYARM